MARLAGGGPRHAVEPRRRHAAQHRRPEAGVAALQATGDGGSDRNAPVPRSETRTDDQMTFVAVMARLGGLVLFLLPEVAYAQHGVPLPRGWIGTTNQWLQGLGIAFALLNLVLLAFAWRSLRAGTITS